MNKYLPDYAVSPGDVIMDELEIICMSQQELADRAGMPLIDIVAVCEARMAITREIAMQLDGVLSLSAEMLVGLERLYQETLARLDHTAKAG